MNGLITWSLARGRMMIALMILAFVAGITAYKTLPKEGAPNIDVPFLYVSVPFPGITAEDSERLLVKPLEAELRSLPNMKRLTAFAAENHAGVFLEFHFGFDKQAALADVRDRVDRARSEMPDGIEATEIFELNMAEFPIIVVALSGDVPERTLNMLARGLQREIEALPGVLEAGMAGKRDEMLEIIIDPVKLDSYNVTADELLRAINNNNRVVPAGAMETTDGRFAVSVPGAFEKPEDVFDLPLKARGDRVITVADVAEVRRSFVDPKGIARYNGKPTVALQVKKRIGENIIDTAQSVRDKVQALTALWPESLQKAVKVEISMDDSRRVSSMVRQLEGSVLTAIMLVIITVVLTLGLRSSILVACTVPLSFLLSFALIAAFGMSVNNMVMFGMILAVGMLVDGGIVVAEYADTRMAEGASPTDAYGEAAQRMFWPVVSSTATTLCAFLPMLLWPGMPGQFMRYLPITMIFVLSASLLAALIFMPVLGSVLGRLFAFIGRPFRRLLPAAATTTPIGPRQMNLYGRFFAWLIRNPLGPITVIIAATVLMYGIFVTFQANNRGVEFFVKTEPERAKIFVRARGNLSIQEKDALVRLVEDRIRDIDGIASTFAFSGEGGLMGRQRNGPKDSVGEVQIELRPYGTRPPGDQIIAQINERVRNLPGAYAEVTLLKEGPESGKPIQIRLTHDDWDLLHAEVRRLRAHLENMPGLREVDDTRPLPGIEWRLEVDRNAAGRMGADIASIGVMVQMLTRGAYLGSYRPDDSDEELEIRARFPADDRSLEMLDQLRIRTHVGLVPLSNFVSRTAERKVGEIARIEGRRYLDVRADVMPGVNANAKIAELRDWIKANPPKVGASFVGDFEEQAESQKFLGKAFLGALGLMFVILLAQFNSLFETLLVLSAVVMSVAGVMLGMLVMDQPFSVIMTGIGIVALAGIVVNNNIVLIDTYQNYRNRMNRLDAIAWTVQDRLRPVLLTTITTMVGLLPMMFAANISLTNMTVTFGEPTALWWVQLATAVVFGLGFSTVLTLMVTPSVLALRVWASRGGRWLLNRFSREKRDRDVRLDHLPKEIDWQVALPETPTAAPVTASNVTQLRAAE